MKQSLRPKFAAQFLGINRVTLFRWSKQRADFPKPHHLSARCVVFDADALKAWRDAQVSTVSEVK
ncbi:MAG: AlpA family phage regulatory protein [Rhodocyclaceae bacterium]|nr:AlpA family phage regulatory protein [Rhodocyclaceae bacterium]